MAAGIEFVDWQFDISRFRASLFEIPIESSGKRIGSDGGQRDFSDGLFSVCVSGRMSLEPVSNDRSFLCTEYRVDSADFAMVTYRRMGLD